MSKATAKARQSKEFVEQAGTTAVTEDPHAPEKSKTEKIAEAAYFKAEKRNFEPGHEMQDWLQAEDEVQ